MAVSAQYRYTALSSARSIRVIELQPDHDPSAQLCCVLKEVSLGYDHATGYSALSYSWEGQTPTCPVNCNSYVLHVTRNCRDAMLKLRKAEEVVNLWIDSICINQTDIPEKNIQVAMMGEIYNKADQVVIWLGEWTPAMYDAVEFLKDLGTPPQTSEMTGEEGHEVVLLHRRRLQEKVTALRQKAILRASDDVLACFFHRSWFSRMWTVQEVVLARADSDDFHVVVYNGRDPADQIPWVVLVAGVDALIVCKYDLVDLSKTVKLYKLLTLQILMKRYSGLREIYDMKGGDLIRDPMVWPIMCHAREKQASDAKDKVFALYNVFHELEIATNLPLPDYSRSVEDVYRDLTIACIESDKMLDVLFDAPSDLRHLRPQLASWVPDWSDPGWRGKGDTDSRIAVNRGRFCAAGPATAQWAFSADRRQLHLRGKIVDEIILCGDPFCSLYGDRTSETIRSMPETVSSTAAADKSLDLSKAYEKLKTWMSMYNWHSEYPGTQESGVRALQRTLQQDFRVDDDSDGEPGSGAGDFDTWFKVMWSSYSSAELFRMLHAPRLGLADDDISVIQDIVSQVEPDTLALGYMSKSQYHRRATAFSNRKSFFLTASERIGTAAARVDFSQPPKAVHLIQPGDEIAVIAGLAMPVILRPVACDTGDVASHGGNGHGGRVMYRLVTHAYVHGIMYGEAWEDENSGFEGIVLL